VALGGLAGLIVNAATRTALGSGSFGDNFVAAIPDAIGQTIGAAFANSEGDGVAGFGPAYDARMSDSNDPAFDAAAYLSNEGYTGQITAEPLTPEPVDLSGLKMTIPSISYDDGEGSATTVTGSPPQALTTAAQPSIETVVVTGTRQPNGSANPLLTNVVAIYGLNSNSPYAKRAQHYLDMANILQQRGYKNTYYFKSVSAMTANLANMDLPVVGVEAGFSPAARAYGYQLSQGIENLNNAEFTNILNGQISQTGPSLDTLLITNEQNYIQGQLSNLAENDPALYTSFIQAINADANITGPLAFANFLTDPSISIAAQNTIQQLGRPIDFANEQDRITMGQQMVSVLRSAYQLGVDFQNQPPPPSFPL
jgi:hypothetical protein